MRMREHIDVDMTRDAVRKRMLQLESELDGAKRELERCDKETAAVHEALGVHEGLVLHAQNVEKALRNQIDALEATLRDRDDELKSCRGEIDACTSVCMCVCMYVSMYV